jgi:2-keto-4-pentenoate hydratase/2-oxohepta-3-ene-1,7-dioic acid hydratase in catechol pathway
MIPKGSTKLDWEVEIAFVMGRRTRYVEEKDALSYVAGYAVCNDVSERAFQMDRAGQWMKGKCFETSGPLGPWLVTTDEIKDVQGLPMFLDVNGKRMQTGSTKTMIFSIAHLVHYISQFLVLEAGDVVTTGTPPGVGLGMKPTPVFLKAGDVMHLGIEGLGSQTQKVVPHKL